MYIIANETILLSFESVKAQKCKLLGYYSDLGISGGHPGARRFTPRVYILKNELNFRKVNKIIGILPKKLSQTDYIVKSY